jgi:hypothetical protein
MNSNDAIWIAVIIGGFWCWRLDARIGKAESSILARLDELKKKQSAD